MSQSDYIRHKKLSAELKEISKLSPVLDSQKYTAYKEYSLENTIPSVKNVYYRFIPEGTQFVYEMIRNNAGNCSNMEFCVDTNLRNNRVLNSVGGTKYEPKPMRPLALKTIKYTNPEKVGIQNNN
jgi:tRNA U38,U39,U40 pseudouridine synthase TruA